MKCSNLKRDHLVSITAKSSIILCVSSCPRSKGGHCLLYGKSRWSCFLSHFYNLVVTGRDFEYVSQSRGHLCPCPPRRGLPTACPWPRTPSYPSLRPPAPAPAMLWGAVLQPCHSPAWTRKRVLFPASLNELHSSPRLHEGQDVVRGVVPVIYCMV